MENKTSNLIETAMKEAMESKVNLDARDIALDVSVLLRKHGYKSASIDISLLRDIEMAAKDYV